MGTQLTDHQLTINVDDASTTTIAAAAKLDEYERKYACQRLGAPGYFSSQFQYILRHLCQRRSYRQRILDLGGGTGEYSVALQQLGHKVTLFDFSSTAVEKSRELGVSDAICGDFYAHEFGSRQFDVVLAKGFSCLNTDVLPKIDWAVSRINSLLRPGGHFVYWGQTDLSGEWSNSGWYNMTAAEINAAYGKFWVFDAFRYQCRLPHFVNRLICNRRSYRRLTRSSTLIAVRPRSE